MVFGTVAGDTPNKHVRIVQLGSGANLYGLAWPGFPAPDREGRAELSSGGSFLGFGRAVFAFI